MLKVTNLSCRYKRRTVLEGISFRVAGGEIVSIVGPNGVGKTTLLKTIAGILKPWRGRVVIDEQPIENLKGKALARKIAYVPQDFPVRFPASVFDSVLSGRRPYLAWRPSPRDIELTAQVLLELRLEDLARRSMQQLSGGQVQKVLLARALVQETPYLVLDEPTSSLDLRHQLEILELIRSQAHDHGKGVILAVHDLNLAARFSSTILMLSNGRIFCSGSPTEVMTRTNIRRVYGVDAFIGRENGHLIVQPLRCVEQERARLNQADA